ncbi:hybrid sensor histidine kinase/response regulator [Marinomonas agarivorans]|nr:hybrid sensor histidine kinase/response regulator [Marinomonas agarivorans]
MTVFWVSLSFLYVLGLFWVARWGDKERPIARRLTRHPLIYSLSLAIYCTAWTFYGAVGEAARSGWSYLPILLGPILLYTFAFPFLQKLVLVSHKQNITSIADFIGSRYGKRPLAAAFVILIAVLAIIPYIALQLKAIGANFMFFTANTDTSATIITLLATLAVGIFAILFGTRKVEVTEYRSGMMLAIAVESLFKLFAIICIGVFAISLFIDIDASSTGFNNTYENWLSDDLLSFNFIIQTLMAAAAVVCLPRQFHVTVIDNQTLKQLSTARWVFPAYLLIFACLIPPIAIVGDHLFAASTNADTYVIQLALLSGNSFIQIAIFLGGLSATTAMIIVATFALSIMISNDVIMPLMLARASSLQKKQPLYRKKVLRIRRFAITAILLLSYWYYQEMANSESLTGTGTLAFSLVLQLIPAVVGGLYWRKGHAIGVYAGLTLGCLFWLFWIMLSVTNHQSLPLQGVYDTSDRIIFGAFISFLINIFGYICGSLLATERLADRIQAIAFVSPTTKPERHPLKPKSHAINKDLIVLLETFLGQQKCHRIIDNYCLENNVTLSEKALPEDVFIDFCERILGGVIGGSSARTIVNSVVMSKQIGVEEMVTYLDEATQAIQFNQNLLFVSMDNLAQAISVIDKDLRLVAWNKTYSELYPYPDNMLSVGTPIEKLIRYNAEQGEFGVGDVETQVQKRLEYLRQGNAHRFLRQRANGRVIEMVGNPLPEGGFVTSFTDITEHIESQYALKEANIDLEKRIDARGAEVKSINDELLKEIERRAQIEKELQKTKAEAEKANATKTEFLALASHDILQPLNAAKLYLEALQSSKLDEADRTILDKLSVSMHSTETLISTLLEIARFDQGAVQPTLQPCSLTDILTPVISEFSVIAQEKGLELRTRVQNFPVYTDPVYLRRIIQNFLSNAIKYTPQGKVLLACRKQGNTAIIQVWDTGVGIPKAEQDKVFDDFYRWQNTQEPGSGLGLGLVKRMQKALNLRISVTSTVDKGSCFSIAVPLHTAITQTAPQQQHTNELSPSTLQHLTVWCIDDDKNNLDAMALLMTKWQCQIQCFGSYQSCLAASQQTLDTPPDLLLVDYQLGESADGLTLIKNLRLQFDRHIPAILITAVRSTELVEICQQLHIKHMLKPTKPAKLRAFLQSL